MRPPLLTPDEVARSPELALLAAIEHALDLAIVTLVAAQPELRPAPEGYDAVTSDAAERADAVIVEAQTLQRAIAAYRDTVLAEPDAR